VARRISAGLLFLLMALCAGAVSAAIDPYQFEREADRLRYQQFIAELRCPKCQNQNLAGSDAPIAQDLRQQLYLLIREGKSDREITDFMVARYGEFVLYRPPLDARTALLWALPALLLLIGIGVIVMIVRRHRRAAPESRELSNTERARLQALLDQREERP
jgi:cytochrome c-type biogenesis protein CcmH